MADCCPIVDGRGVGDGGVAVGMVGWGRFSLTLTSSSFSLFVCVVFSQKGSVGYLSDWWRGCRTHRFLRVSTEFFVVFVSRGRRSRSLDRDLNVDGVFTRFGCQWVLRVDLVGWLEGLCLW